MLTELVDNLLSLLNLLNKLVVNIYSVPENAGQLTEHVDSCSLLLSNADLVACLAVVRPIVLAAPYPHHRQHTTVGNDAVIAGVERQAILQPTNDRHRIANGNTLEDDRSTFGYPVVIWDDVDNFGGYCGVREEVKKINNIQTTVI